MSKMLLLVPRKVHEGEATLYVGVCVWLGGFLSGTVWLCQC